LDLSVAVVLVVRDMGCSTEKRIATFAVKDCSNSALSTLSALLLLLYRNLSLSFRSPKDMGFPFSTPTEQETIQRLAFELSRSLQTAAQPQRSSPASPLDIPSLSLHFPDDILSPLETLAIPLQTRKTLKDTFTCRAAELQAVYRNHYQRSCAVLTLGNQPEQHLIALRDAYEAMFRQRCLPLLRARVSTVLSEVTKRQQCLRPERRPTFNTVGCHDLMILLTALTLFSSAIYAAS
jgi:hypothetical protein